ncbi:MAG: hypothetical protein ACI9OB_000295 [Nonlabens sp.]|jgi:uncharacterized protein YkwD
MSRRMASLLLATVLLLVIPSAGIAGTSASSRSSSEALLVSLINQHRANAGQSALTGRADLHREARRWSFAQAESENLEHNPGLAGSVCCWAKVGENVATVTGHLDSSSATIAATLFDVWQGSGIHDRTMQDVDYDQVGVGVVIDGDGVVWATTVFRRCDGTDCVGSAQGPAADTSTSWGGSEPKAEAEPEPRPEAQPQPQPEPHPHPQPKPEPTGLTTSQPTAEPVPTSATAAPVPELTTAVGPTPAPAAPVVGPDVRPTPGSATGERSDMIATARVESLGVEVMPHRLTAGFIFAGLLAATTVMARDRRIGRR